MKKIKRLKAVFGILCSLAIIAGVSAGVIAGSKSVDYSEVEVPDFIVNIANGSDDIVGDGSNFDRAAAEFYNEVSGDNTPAFKSGGADHTHQYIAANSLVVLANDIGNSEFNDYEYASLVAEGADYPDKSEIGFVFLNHFYNPVTEKNYMGTSVTAKTRAVDYFDKAVTEYKNGNVALAMSYIGRGAHYVEDACETHHANNRTAVDSNHSSYEKYVDENRLRYKLPGDSMNPALYEEARIIDVGQIIRNNSYASYTLLSAATGSTSNDDYDDAGRSMVRNGLIANIQYFYKFGVEVGIYD